MPSASARSALVCGIAGACAIGAPALADPAGASAVANNGVEPAMHALRGADLVVIDDPAPGRPPSVLIATRVQAAPRALAAVLGDPRAYHEAIPSLIRADVVGRRRNSAADAAGEDQLLQWELEIPLFNLKGKAWVSPRANGVDLILTEGDLAPGTLSFSWAEASAAPAGGPGAAPSGGGTILTLRSQANMRAAGWLFRRIASHSPFGESAMNAAAAYVVVRAAAERAQHPGEPAAHRPRVDPAAPAPATLIGDAGALADSPALAPFRRRGAVAAVRRADSGRLATTAVAVPFAIDAKTLTTRLASPDNWSAFPGWRRVKPLAGDRVAIEDNLPLVDLETTWQLRRDRAQGFSAIAIDGATRGAMFGWEVREAQEAREAHSLRTSFGVLSLYPRLEAAGYIPRKFIAAEPLLEHGMSLALAYVDAMSMARALARGGVTLTK